MTLVEFGLRGRAHFGAGAFERLGIEARALGFRRSLVVSDRGLAACGRPAQAAALLRAAGVSAELFHDFGGEPDDLVVARAAEAARAAEVDSLVALGGGSALDCAKGLNFVLTGGGRIQDYRGFGRARAPLLPMMGVPTTAGTGSEAQAYAVIADSVSHAKLACGDPGAAFRVVLLDPMLTLGAPRVVSATAGYDALGHAVESYVCTRRNSVSALFAREAFRLLVGAYERMLAAPEDLGARADMLLGAHLAGAAIDAAMLGAAHACANPLSARFAVTHGQAVALMLAPVVRFNAPVVEALYAELLHAAGLPALGAGAAATLAARLDALAEVGTLPRRLAALGASAADLDALAEDALQQWTGQFNPRALDREAARALFACVL